MIFGGEVLRNAQRILTFFRATNTYSTNIGV
jgi:hypothetical protein